MKDISYHILDIVQNSLHAGATSVLIEMIEKTDDQTLLVSITDDGKGMNQEQLNQVTDPFYTSSSTKKVGLGIPLLKQNAELTGGSFRIVSELNKGTQVVACFKTGNVDMIPSGDSAMTMKLLIAANPEVDFNYRHRKDKKGFELNTSLIRKELGNIRLNQKEVLDYISDFINQGLKDISAEIN
jgi:hypothetical protein